MERPVGRVTTPGFGDLLTIVANYLLTGTPSRHAPIPTWMSQEVSKWLGTSKYRFVFAPDVVEGCRVSPFLVPQTQLQDLPSQFHTILAIQADES